jgi:hypothetical protein
MRFIYQTPIFLQQLQITSNSDISRTEVTSRYRFSPTMKAQNAKHPAVIVSRETICTILLCSCKPNYSLE